MHMDPGLATVSTRARSTRLFSDRVSAPALIQPIIDVLSEVGGDVASLRGEIRRLAEVHGDTLYAELLFLLTHLRFPPEEARRHWQLIVELHGSIAQRVAFPVDIRVALVSYFVDIRHNLRNPMLIELELFRQTQKDVYRDELTGLFNYRYLSETLSREVQRADRAAAPLSLLMVDVDDFKRFNDGYGHQTGNQALAAIGRALDALARDSDIAIRYGGEEFATLLPGTAKDGAILAGERIRAAIAQLRLPDTDTGHTPETPTVSIGVATYPGDADDGETLLVAGDRALYVAKGSGKNRVVPYGESRRSYRRLKLTLEGSARALSAPEQLLTTLDVSEGGFLFLADREIPVGTLVEMRLRLPHGDDGICTATRIVRSKPSASGAWTMAARVIDMDDADRRRLRVLLRSLAADPRHSAEPQA